jgi:Rad3-related DNA helicase
MESSLEAWTKAGLIQVTGGRPYLAGKPLFREGRDARANQDTVTRYKAAAVTPQGAVLTCVFRGRNSEGSNFPDDQCRGIVLVGVPYANYGDPLVRAQIAYYDRRSMGLGNKWYTMDAFRAANQALGRGIRSREDWCHYWLLDQRYAQHQDLVSAWAKGAGPTIAGPETL